MEETTLLTRRFGGASSQLPPFRAGCVRTPESWPWRGGGEGGHLLSRLLSAAATVARVTVVGRGAQVGEEATKAGGQQPASRVGRGWEGPQRAGGGRSRCLVTMGTVQLFPSPRRCQWRGARVRGYCRTAAICCGLGPNNTPLLRRGARRQEALLIGEAGAAPRASSLLSGPRWGAWWPWVLPAARAAPATTDRPHQTKRGGGGGFSGAH